MKIRTPRLLLRPITLDDVAEMDALNRAPGVLQYLASEPPELDQVEARVRSRLAESALHHGYDRFAVLGAAGEFIGWAGLDVNDGDIFNPELGYRFRPEFWGQGLATEASRALVEHAVTQLGASSVVAETMTVNQASRAVMERIGMGLHEAREATEAEQVPGWEQGVVRYRVLAVDWLANNPSARDELHEAQQAALVAHRGGDAAATDRLDALRRLGMELARIETDEVRASDDLVRRLAGQSGVLPDVRG